MGSVGTNSKTAIVTGSARGIGRAIALKLASSGYDVTISDLPSMEEAAQATSKEISKLGRKTHVVLGDVSVRSDVEKIVASHVENVGELFTMVANAGICKVKEAVDLTEKDVQRMFEVKVYGVFNCYQVAAKEMIKKGTKGGLIGCSSIVGYKPFALLTHYSASKWAVRGLTQGMAMEMAPHGIRVNAYCPGIHDTKMWEDVDEALGQIQGRPKGESIRSTRRT